MPIAVCLIREQPHYRRDAFVAGLVVCGYQVQFQPLRAPGPNDVLLIWNRSPRFHYEALRHDAVGSPVIVAENGYLDAVDDHGHQYFSLARDHHNGAGRWPQPFIGTGAPARWPSLQQQVQPWRREGAYILVLPQRGIGAPGVAMPRQWEVDISRRLRKLTSRPVRIRPHPGVKSKARPFAPDLVNVHTVVTWGSGAALKAMLAGVPVFYDMPRWIGAGAAEYLGNVRTLEMPIMHDTRRAVMFERLSWCQWTVADIAGGLPLRWLINLGSTKS